MKLYTYWRSQASFRVRIALRLDGDDPTARRILDACMQIEAFALKHSLIE